MRLTIVCLLLSLIFTGCAGFTGEIHTGPGIVRNLNWQNREITVELKTGTVLALRHACRFSSIPVWQGMEFNDLVYREYNDEVGTPICTDYIKAIR
jgi:hypothetical protein